MATKTKQQAAKNTITFAGPPHRMMAVGDAPALSAAAFVPGKALGKYLITSKSPLRVRANPRVGGARLKLKLARDTPPGAYGATIEAAEGAFECAVNVSAFQRVAFDSPQVIFRAKPGETDEFVTTLRNQGNSAIEVPKTAAVGIFDDTGLETAFAATYGRKTDNVNDFLSGFTTKLGEAHGGLMKLSVVEGAGTHPGGAIVMLRLRGHVPESAKRGHRYHGGWMTGFANVALSIQVLK